MSIFNNIAGLLCASVGNNMDNDPDDVENTKRNFAAIGRYKRPVENGYIDQELDDAIHGFQRDNNLKVDGIMRPGGETETALLSTTMKLSKPPKKDMASSGVQEVSYAPALMGLARTGIAMSPRIAGMWLQSEMDEAQRKKVIQQLRERQIDTDQPDPRDDCDEIFDNEWERCKNQMKKLGKNAIRICKETATTRYHQCLKGTPEPDRRGLLDNQWE